MTDLTPQQLVDAIVRRLNENWDRFAVKDRSAMTDRIVRDPAIMVGKPVIRGTRITVELILRQLSIGWSPAEIIEGYPGLTEDDIRAAQAYAADLVADSKAASS